MHDQEVVDVLHCQALTDMGIKAKICDADFLACIMDLLKIHGPTVVLGKQLTKAIPYFVHSVKYNMGGTNAAGKVQRDQNIQASVKLLTVLAESCVGQPYAKQVSDQYTESVN